MASNRLKQKREAMLMSRLELARRANISINTLVRIEDGKPCRLSTKRKILEALGCSLSEGKKLFTEMSPSTNS